MNDCYWKSGECRWQAELCEGIRYEKSGCEESGEKEERGEDGKGESGCLVSWTFATTKSVVSSPAVACRP